VTFSSAIFVQLFSMISTDSALRSPCAIAELLMLYTISVHNK